MTNLNIKVITQVITTVILNMIFILPAYAAHVENLWQKSMIKSRNLIRLQVASSKNKQSLHFSDSEMKLQKKITDHMGNEHSRYDQYYQGIPVWGYQVIIRHNKGTNYITGNTITGKAVSDIGPDIKHHHSLLAVPNAQLFAKNALPVLARISCLSSPSLGFILLELFANKPQQVSFSLNEVKPDVTFFVRFFTSL